ncbi:MAG: efflux RND transporter periplasmic adaptor subunit [Bacteroidales bacterium]|nr:efflux RND transporter periplasmic adaptor subunit [Bacteroidales bacterium]
MKKITYLIILALFVSACGSQTNKEKLKELKKERNEIQKELSAINNKIGKIEQTIKEQGEKLPSRNITHVRTKKTSYSPFRHYLKIQGEVTSDNNIAVPAEAPGVVQRIYVEEGDEVTAGQKLAQLDAASLENQLEELKKGYELAKTVYERRQRLWDKEIGSEIQYLQARNKKERLEKQIESVKEQLSKKTITSPIDGTVDDVLLKEGEMASAGRGALQVVKMADMKIRAEISESYLNQVERGDPVSVSPANASESFTSKIKTVGQVINQMNRTYYVEIAIPQQIKNVTPNMIMDLEVLNYKADSAISVPVNIIQKTNQRRFLYVAGEENGQEVAVKKWITIGKTYNKKAEIIEGLQGNENIIVAGYQDLSDGEKIIIE